MRLKFLVTILFLLILDAHLLTARLTQHWTYQEMFDKSDLVVIATFLSSKDKSEQAVLPDYKPPLVVAEVLTEFEANLVLKGPKDVKRFQLHHYRYKSDADEWAVSNTPFLVKIPKYSPSFLLFLTRQSDGNYVPVTGQTDPAILSVLELTGAAE